MPLSKLWTREIRQMSLVRKKASPVPEVQGQGKYEGTLWIFVRATRDLTFEEAVPLHPVPNGYAAYSQNVCGLGFVALGTGKRIGELPFL